MAERLLLGAKKMRSLMAASGEKPCQLAARLKISRFQVARLLDGTTRFVDINLIGAIVRAFPEIAPLDFEAKTAGRAATRKPPMKPEHIRG